jgi:8-oxo-dGTP pyrophosphatase MutT (NUDIX family)
MIEGCGGLFYAKKTGRFLFLLRDNTKYSNTWDLPGGKIEEGENVGAALEREISEEIGIFLYDKKIVPLDKFTSDTGAFCYHTFMIIVDYEFIPDLNREHKGYCWVPIEFAPAPLHPGVFNTFGIDIIKEKINLIKEAS